ncbi:MAG: DUF1614 domain-containing protein [Firmicutes bacterium]|nr:DUF1614 domain-containing protein [Bacillota bacterium]
MPTGMILLLVVAALVYFGVAQRILDRMRLTDSQALLFIGLMIGGSYLQIPLMQGKTEVSINVGGAVVPLALVIYLLIKADTGGERFRALAASVVTAAVVFGVSQLTDFDPYQNMFVDPLWLFGIIAGVVGYLSGRSRRASFIAGVLGILLTDFIHLVRSVSVKLPTRVAFGGAGVFDTVILAGLIGVALAELVGESRERLQGGPEPREDAGILANEDFVKGEDRE